jgi:hypothetical protein
MQPLQDELTEQTTEHGFGSQRSACVRLRSAERRSPRAGDPVTMPVATLERPERTTAFVHVRVQRLAWLGRPPLWRIACDLCPDFAPIQRMPFVRQHSAMTTARAHVIRTHHLDRREDALPTEPPPTVLRRDQSAGDSGLKAA